MNKIDTERDINVYLTRLTQALAGQDKALVQDALFDAEAHFRATLEDQPALAFQEIRDSYGSAQEIAALYCDMESKVSMALHGPLYPNKMPRQNRFFDVIKDISAYRAMSYMLLSLPLGLVYFSWVVIVGLSSLTASIFIVGIPFFLAFLRSMQLFSLFEGRLIETLLDQRMPRRPQYQHLAQHSRGWSGWSARMRQMLENRRNWTTALYLVLQCPLGLLYFFLTSGCALISIAIMLSPIVDPILHSIDPTITIDLNWYWLPVAFPAGLCGFTVSLHLAKLLGKCQASLARYLLVSIASDD
jgi:hypothetical protein